MNIRIPHSWLLDYVSTKISPEEIAKKISQSGPSIDRVIHEQGETLYDVEITTNRPDAYAIYGFAREAAAILGVPFKEQFTTRFLQKQKEKYRFSGSARVRLDVDIQNTALCRRYCGIVMDGVQNGASPEWMQRRLRACGLRPISTVVDITNYVMLEYGQPLHAFDAEKIVSHQKTSGSSRHAYKRIVVRNARKQESAVTLDGEKKNLDPSMLVIADDAQVLALAGIKGCRGADITDATNTIILEAASFDPLNVRITSRALNIRTDSSARFEKNLSAEYPMYALFRMVELLKQYAGAQVATPVADAYPVRERIRTISFDPALLERILGVPVHPRDIKRILFSLGFSVQTQGKQSDVTVPFWRSADVKEGIDLVEEVGRMVGYQDLPAHPMRGETPYCPPNRTCSFEQRTKEHVRDMGWTEVMTYSFVSKKLLESCGFGSAGSLAVVNPLSADFEMMRPSLLPGIIQTVADNEQKRERLAFFELSKIYIPQKNNLPHERTMLSGIFSEKKKETDMYREVRGLCEVLTDEWFGDTVSFVRFVPLEKPHPFFDEKKTTAIFFHKEKIGLCGMVQDGILRAMGIKTLCAGYEIDMQAVQARMSRSHVFVPIPKYPSIVRDIAFVSDALQPYENIVSAMRDTDALITAIELFDVFESEKIGRGRRSLAFHVTYQSPDRTLLAGDVDMVHARLLEKIQKTFHADMR